MHLCLGIWSDFWGKRDPLVDKLLRPNLHVQQTLTTGTPLERVAIDFSRLPTTFLSQIVQGIQIWPFWFQGSKTRQLHDIVIPSGRHFPPNEHLYKVGFHLSWYWGRANNWFRKRRQTAAKLLWYWVYTLQSFRFVFLFFLFRFVHPKPRNKLWTLMKQAWIACTIISIIIIF
jgi:hypothetical protein